MDGERGRRMYVGNTAGELLLVNSMNGVVIDMEHYHTKDITVTECLRQYDRLY